MTDPHASLCSACRGAISDDAEFCPHCGASLQAQARDSVAMDRVRLALAERYPVERRIGEGGMATVYLAKDPKHQRDVAVKVLRPEIAAGLGAERFLREIAVAASLQHPHILPLYDSGEVLLPGDATPVLYYVMPFVKGESLRDRLDRETQLPLEEAVRFAQEVAGALDYAHRQGIVHRDIKPENILLSEGHALVADFGIARAIGSSALGRITHTGMAIGTPVYMSPEQASGAQTPDGRSDIYSLGCVLYEMLAGEPPFTGPTAQSVIAKRFSEPIPQLTTVREVPEEIDAAVRTSLARVPADRFATAAQMAVALGARRSSPALTPPAGAQRPPARRPPGWALGASGALALVLVVAFGRVLLRSRDGAGARISSSRVAVFPFGHHGGAGAQDVSGALVALLSTVLDGVGDLHTVDPSAVLAVTGEGAGGAPDRERARSIATRLGARRYVIGDVVEGAPGRFTITAAAYDVADGPGQARRVTVEGDARGQMFHVVNDLAVRLLDALGITESPRRLESISTSSIVALNEYLKGETARRHGDYPAAAEAFGRAVEADSLFALAWFRQAYALTYTEAPEKADEPITRALALRERLSARDRRLAEALGALVHVDPEQADRLYRSIVYDYPDDVEGWFGRADVMLHFGPLYALAMDSLSQALERTLFLDPHHAEARGHLPWAAAIDARRDLLDSATARDLAADSNGFLAPVWRIVRPYARGDSAAVAAALARAGAMDDLQRLIAVNIAATLRDPVGTRRLALALLAAPGRQPVVRAYGHRMAAYLELAVGHARAAERQLAAADSLDASSALEHRALLALPPFLETPDSVRARLVRQLQGWNAAAVPPSIPANPWVAPHDSLHVQLRLYLLGALAARGGDDAAAQGAARELLRADTSVAQGAIGRALAHEVLGDLALAHGRSAEGLAELDRSGLRGRYARTWQRAYSTPFFSQSYERFLRARALARLGRNVEALRWYRSLWMANAFDLLYLAPSELDQAQLMEQQGDRAGALRHYGAFVTLWHDADPGLQPAVVRAQRRVEALASGRAPSALPSP